MSERFRTEVRMPSMNGRGTVGGSANRFAPGPKPRNAKKTLRRILRIYLTFGKSIFLAFLLIALSSAITVALPYFIGLAFRFFQPDPSLQSTAPLQALLFIIAALTLCQWVLSTLNGAILLKTSQKLVFNLRNAFFSKMQVLPLSFFDTTPHGDTMSRLTNDMDQISSNIAQATTQLLSGTLTILGSLALMLTLNLPLTLTVLCCLPLVFVLTALLSRKSKKYFLAQQQDLGALNSQIEEDILGLQMVKAFGRQQSAMESFDQCSARLCRNSTNAQIWAGFMMPLMNVINNLTFAMVSVVGGMLSIRHGLSIGTVVTFLNYSKQFSSPLGAIAGMFNTIQSALAGAERVFEIFDKAAEAQDAPDAAVLAKPQGNVVFRKVCFSYENGKQVLKNVSFEVRAGETIALVGETGAGKTTIVNLLTRFYEPDSGEILIDGVNICQLKRQSLRKCFSVVLQDTCLFTGTVADNIRYTKPSATDAEVAAAAKVACADSFIQTLPQGYRTLISGSTDTLSQGQRQLLAIARAALYDSPILILDEATSSVDTKTEKKIQLALLRLMKGHTAFFIAHRLSTIRDADRIMVVGDGCIVEQGNHDALMAAKGVYYRMVLSQLGHTEEDSGSLGEHWA
ncbi:MAG: ABC transporter ATP-binding protein [Clostridia bacterium]